MGAVRTFLAEPKTNDELQPEELKSMFRSHDYPLPAGNLDISRNQALYFIGDRNDITAELRKLSGRTVTCAPADGAIGLVSAAANFPMELLKAGALGPTLGPVNAVRGAVNDMAEAAAPRGYGGDLTSDNRSPGQVGLGSFLDRMRNLGGAIKSSASLGTTTVTVLELCAFATHGKFNWGGNTLVCVNLADRLDKWRWELRNVHE